MKKKAMALVMAAILGITVLAGCGNSTSAGKVLKVATNCNFPPYEYYEDEKPAGIDVEIVQAICDKIGYTMEFTDMEFGSIIPAVQSGKVDLGFGAVTITEERSKSIHFTTSYANGNQTIIVLAGSSIQSVEDLKGEDILIGVQQDTTGDLSATEEFGDAHVSRFLKGADAVNALLTGKVSAVIIDDSPAKTFAAQNEGKLELVEAPYIKEEYGFMLSLDNDELYKTVNDALEALIADGTVQKIIDKHTSAE